MNFHTGDRVMIRPDIAYIESHTPGITSSMRQMSTEQIYHVSRCMTYAHLEEDSNDFNWHEDWLIFADGEDADKALSIDGIDDLI